MSVRTACGWPSKYFLAPIAEPPLARVCQHEFVGDFSHDVIGGYGGDLREGNFLEQSVALSRSAAQAIDEDIAVDEDFRPLGMLARSAIGMIYSSSSSLKSAANRHCSAGSSMP